VDAAWIDMSLVFAGREDHVWGHVALGYSRGVLGNGHFAREIT
jgi:hypothetical protein